MSQPARSSTSTASPTRLVRLSGPSDLPDVRLNAYRPDLADARLAGQVVASHYADPVIQRCVLPTAAMRGRPDADAPATSELLFGEAFAVVERRADWCWGYGCHDRYVGYVPASALGTAAAPTHRVSVPQALVFKDADIKSPLRATLPLGAGISASDKAGQFHPLAGGGFIHERHVGDLTPGHGDAIALGRQFLGTPYLWGGRTRAGIDCSGFIQAILAAVGHAAPRDSDMQRDTLGIAIDPDAIAARDLVFFPGHVGIMASDTELLHANAFWMSTVIEPLADVVARLRQAGHDAPITAVKRIWPDSASEEVATRRESGRDATRRPREG